MLLLDAFATSKQGSIEAPCGLFSRSRVSCNTERDLQIKKTVLDCVVELSTKTPIYATLLGKPPSRMILLVLISPEAYVQQPLSDWLLWL